MSLFHKAIDSQRGTQVDAGSLFGFIHESRGNPSITFEHLPGFDIAVEFTFILYHFAEANAPAGAPRLLDASRLLYRP